jgi:hypothetical protein
MLVLGSNSILKLTLSEELRACAELINVTHASTQEHGSLSDKKSGKNKRDLTESKGMLEYLDDTDCKDWTEDERGCTFDRCGGTYLSVI